MNKAYEVNPSVQKHLVIAENMGRAEEIYNQKYGYGAAKKIELISCYVLQADKNKDKEIEKQNISPKRYEPTYFTTEDGHIVPEMIKCTDGDWIKFSQAREYFRSRKEKNK
jgi:hypothetical protein